MPAAMAIAATGASNAMPRLEGRRIIVVRLGLAAGVSGQQASVVASGSDEGGVVESAVAAIAPSSKSPASKDSSSGPVASGILSWAKLGVAIRSGTTLVAAAAPASAGPLVPEAAAPAAAPASGAAPAAPAARPPNSRRQAPAAECGKSSLIGAVSACIPVQPRPSQDQPGRAITWVAVVAPVAAWPDRGNGTGPLGAAPPPLSPGSG